MINLIRKFSILSPKILRHRIELRQDRYLSMRKLSNRAARARDLARSKPYGASLKASSHQRRNLNRSHNLRAIFNWVSKVTRDCVGFALLRFVISLENCHHALNQSDAKLKPIATWSLAFSRASGRLRVFTLSSHWFLVTFTFVLICCCDYFGFGFTTLNPKALW